MKLRRFICKRLSALHEGLKVGMLQRICFRPLPNMP